MDADFLKRLQNGFLPIIEPNMVQVVSYAIEDVLNEISSICHLNPKQKLNLMDDISEVVSQSYASSLGAALFVLDKVRNGMEISQALAWLRCKFNCDP